MNAANATAAIHGGTVFIPPSTNGCRIGSNLTISPNVTLSVASGGRLVVPTGATLTINGPILASLFQQIFNVTGTGTIGLGQIPRSLLGAMWWGAKCDGATDDTVALQAAITAANPGGTIIFPFTANGCAIASNAAKALNTDNSNFVTLSSFSQGGESPPGNSMKPGIIFTGTPAVGISARNTVGFAITNMLIGYTNPAFTANLVDLTGANAFRFDNSQFIGTNGTPTATNLIITSSPGNNGRIYKSSFGVAVNAINLGGMNSVTIEDCDFDTAGGTITGTYIKDPASNSRIVGNKFEMFNAVAGTVVLDVSNLGCFGCEFSGNWVGDQPNGYSGTVIKGSGGMDFHGNELTSQAGANTSVLMSLNGGQTALHFTGNDVRNTWGTIFSCNAPVTALDVTGNNWTGITGTFQSGCFTASSTGLVTDNNGITNIFGATQLGSVAFASLGTPVNGTIRYCSDCTIANPCAGGGTGALAKRLNAVWVCN